MTTLKEIKSIEQKIARLERNKALQKIKQRKQDTRRKIELGGLVIKANLHGHSKATILGALLDIKEQLNTNKDVKRLFELKGEKAFLNQE